MEIGDLNVEAYYPSNSYKFKIRMLKVKTSPDQTHYILKWNLQTLKPAKCLRLVLNMNTY